MLEMASLEQIHVPTCMYGCMKCNSKNLFSVEMQHLYSKQNG